eukprot:9473871-Pyramimonas_sp.AAC.1
MGAWQSFAIPSLASIGVDWRLGVDEIAPTWRRFSVDLASISVDLASVSVDSQEPTRRDERPPR